MKLGSANPRFAFGLYVALVAPPPLRKLMESPSPVPPPTSLVVKKGSKMRGKISRGDALDRWSIHHQLHGPLGFGASMRAAYGQGACHRPWHGRRSWPGSSRAWTMWALSIRPAWMPVGHFQQA